MVIKTESNRKKKIQDLTTLYSRVSLFDGSSLVFDALNIGFCVMFFHSCLLPLTPS